MGTDYYIWINLAGSATALLIGALTLLYVRRKVYDENVSLSRHAGSICGAYLAAGLFVLFFHVFITGRLPEMDLSDGSLLLSVMTLALTALCLLSLAAVFSGRRRKEKIIFTNIALLLVLELPVLVLFLIRLRGLWISAGTEFGKIDLPVLTLAFLAMNAAAFLMVNQAVSEESERKLEEARHEAELKRMHFARVEECRRELDMIRGDYNRLLAQAGSLLESEQAEPAQNLLKDLTERIESTKEAPYCSIAAVNAILGAKKEECDRERVALDVDLMLPGALPVKDLDLCMALGNQLDNALRECKKAPDRMETEEAPGGMGTEEAPNRVGSKEASDTPGLSEKPRIRLTGKVVQGYLVLRCANPVYSEEQKEPEGTGYGMKILKDMAERYRGDFFTKREGGSFISQVSLSVG